ncbi:sensor histidine kinase [Paenibacillus sp. GYB003]|uniref:sensor histidine kinase n=1 Tax=Paenibacillus sp. GYB003 TaxID=2994392 RepID=UPI002F9661E7
MKLFVQINVAFGALLVVVLSIAAVIFHVVLLDHFIEVEKDDMRKASATISTQMKTVAVEPIAAAAVPSTAMTPVSAAIPPGLGFDAIVTDGDANIIYSTVPVATVRFSLAKLEAAHVYDVRMLQEDKGERYLIASNALDDGTLTLFTPMSKIKEAEKSLLVRLLVVLCIGGALVFLLSLVITRRLINPLLQLRGELRKVENRRFSDVKRVRAGGEIGDVAQTVYEMAGELEKYNRIQKQFIQNASHELKTPLMSIAGYAEGIRDGVFEGEGVRKGLDIIISESGRLKNIVTEMTLLAKLDGEEGIFRMAPVGIADIVTETIERINPLLVDKGLTIETAYADEAARLAEVRADRDKLLQALLNVVSNATRYARKRIRIGITVGKKQIDISVADDGDGIPDSLLPHLFHRFVKGKDGETGLGLAISRAIVERCGGSIAARNRESGGADVSMRFPAA